MSSETTNSNPERSVENKIFLKIMAVIFSVLTIVSLTLMVLGKIDFRVFLMMFIMAAFVAWYVMPKMNNKRD